MARSVVTIADMNPDFETYRLSDEHEALREAVRALAEKEIAPHAAEVDEQGRYPDEAREALVKAGVQAITIPEEHAGEQRPLARDERHRERQDRQTQQLGPGRRTVEEARAGPVERDHANTAR